MSERLFDEFARVLATPMPRRRAIGLLAGALVSGSLLGPRAARASREDVCGHPGLTVCIAEEYPGTSKPYICCNKTGDSKCCHDVHGAWCCPEDASCGADPTGPNCVSKPMCGDGRPKCVNTCCKRDERCVGGTCKKRCQGERCGSKCCPKGTFCCDPKKGLCCRKGGQCCNASPEGEADRFICCPPGARCTPMILPGQAGRTSNSPRVCCPKDRFVPLSAGGGLCCPPGKVSLGGKLVVPGGGGGGLCCDAESVCGSGASITCCSSVPGFKQRCVNGVCQAA